MGHNYLSTLIDISVLQSILNHLSQIRTMHLRIYQNESIELDTEISGKTYFPFSTFIQQFFLATTQHFHPTQIYARLFPHLEIILVINS